MLLLYNVRTNDLNISYVDYELLTIHNITIVIIIKVNELVCIVITSIIT